MIVEKTYSPAQVAEILQVKDYSIRRWINAGILPAININGRWRIRASALEKFMENREK